MPRNVKKTQRKRRVRRGAKKVYRKRATAFINSGVSLFKNFPKLTRHRACYSAGVTGTSGALGYYHVHANGPQNIDGAGKQPMFWDQMTALYNHYTVLGAKMTIRHVGNSASVMAFVAGIYLNDDNTASTYTNWSGLAESGRARYKVLSINSAGYTGTGQTLVSKFSAKKFFNFKDVKDNSTVIGAASTTTPTETAYFTIFVQDVALASTIAATFAITVDYLVAWSEPKDLAQSS